mgnify:CR=1 FL=1
MSDVPRFGIGDFVWFACYAVATIEEPCPVCFGKKAVTLILGNGEGWIIPCDYCAKGYMEPRGTVSVSEIGPQVRGYTIDRVSVSATAVEYQSDCQILDGDRTFATRDEAMAKATEIAAAENADRAKARDYAARHNAKGKPWSYGYHMREAKEARARAERHEAMARLARKP